MEYPDGPGRTGEEADGAAWQVVARASGMAEASIIAGRLTSEGIFCRLRYEAAGSIYAVTIDGLGEVRILVPATDRDRAREILGRSYEDGELFWDREADPGESPDRGGSRSG